MKELTIRQKARRYDEAIEKARCYYVGANGNEDMITMTTTMFPELKESEGEKWIPKEIAKYLKEKGGFRSCWLAWLEKQGEQKPTVIIPKFRVGDEIKTSNEESLTITKIDEKGYWSEDLFICGFDDADKWELVEQKSDEVEPKFKVGIQLNVSMMTDSLQSKALICNNG